MNCRLFVIFVSILVTVFAQNQYWEEEAGAAVPYQVEDQRFFVPILSDKRSIDQKIRSLKERTANGQFKGILFGRKK
ncbi:Neuropeptide-Like Protein [Caenorhabditis elegans]|uniref:Neuropeptide-Like Protein n=1 Tax=Caenorhabditis elegans TaxID=6239 RepID=Q8MQ09_CAEEL|nr:Neuropeptide-Like Protein [Caenorhabditis elegans]CAD44139.1 Neuropeptide-Like Protein [Caenorhabditis elegans]|eukprot:NP_741620.1 Uncharacterized protein CELE_K07C5.9 [Caenorhabditis elegans]